MRAKFAWMFRHTGDGKVLFNSVTANAEEKTTQIKISARLFNTEIVWLRHVPLAARIKAVNPTMPRAAARPVTDATALETGGFVKLRMKTITANS
jgi:hypothetical protein